MRSFCLNYLYAGRLHQEGDWLQTLIAKGFQFGVAWKDRRQEKSTTLQETSQNLIKQPAHDFVHNGHILDVI